MHGICVLVKGVACRDQPMLWECHSSQSAKQLWTHPLSGCPLVWDLPWSRSTHLSRTPASHISLCNVLIIIQLEKFPHLGYNFFPCALGYYKVYLKIKCLCGISVSYLILMYSMHLGNSIQLFLSPV